MTVLDDLSIVAQERRIGVVGRNGSGKTSLARVLAGLVRPEKGQVLINGVDVAHNRKAALTCVGILFQNPDHQIIFPTVDEEIGFGLTQMGLSRTEVHSAVSNILGQFEKSHWATAPVHHLSQGQKQLVCLMAVLVMAPKVIVLDEPFAGLDIPTTLQLQRILDRLPVTLVHITHDPAILATYDRVIWLEAGRITKDGSARDVLNAFHGHMIKLGAGDDLSDLAG